MYPSSNKNTFGVYGIRYKHGPASNCVINSHKDTTKIYST